MIKKSSLIEVLTRQMSLKISFPLDILLNLLKIRLIEKRSAK